MSVPILDLGRSFASIRPEVEEALKKILDNQNFILGQEVKDFEKHAADYLEIPETNAISCASGTDSLLLALMALDVKAGDEIITTPFTFFATSGTIARLGAKPVFVDVEPNTYNINLNQVADKITAKTKIFLPVHLFGQMTPLENIKSDLDERNIKIVEDAAQAFGTHRIINGKITRAGTFGAIGCYSFFPTKNLGGCGDSGMCVTNDENLAARLKKLRVHGSGTTYFHDEVGINSRLDTIQAAILDIKLKHLEEWNAQRRKLAENYKILFAQNGLEEFLTTPHELNGNYHIYHQYVIKVHERRDDLMKFLDNLNIATRVYYPLALHLQPCFKYLGYKAGDFPEAEKLTREVLALPIFPELKFSEQEELVNAVKKFFRG